MNCGPSMEVTGPEPVSAAVLHTANQKNLFIFEDLRDDAIVATPSRADRKPSSSPTSRLPRRSIGPSVVSSRSI